MPSRPGSACLSPGCAAGLVRLLEPNGQTPAGDKLPGAFLDYLMARRAALIMELRQIDGVLVESGRLQHETLERRVR